MIGVLKTNRMMGCTLKTEKKNSEKMEEVPRTAKYRVKTIYVWWMDNGAVRWLQVVLRWMKKIIFDVGVKAIRNMYWSKSQNVFRYAMTTWEV